MTIAARQRLGRRAIALEEGRRDQSAAIEKSRYHRGTLQRLYGKTVAECGRCGDQPAPARRQQRLGAFRHFGQQPVEQPDPAQEFLVPLDADIERHARRADIGGMGEDLRHRQDPRRPWKSWMACAADDQRKARVVAARQVAVP